MTYKELHTILDNPNKKLTFSEIKQVVYELKNDCLVEQSKIVDETLKLEKGGIDENANHKLGFYSGEANFAQLVLDLLEHFDFDQTIVG